MFDSNISYQPVNNFTPSRQSRRSTRKLSAEDEQLVIELAKENLMAYQIAVKFNTTAQRVKLICAAAGVDVLSKDNQKNKRTKQILSLLQQGYKTQQILNLVDCDRELIAKVRHRHELSQTAAASQAKTAAKAAEARKLTSSGVTVREACEIAGLSQSSYLRYKNITLPKPESENSAIKIGDKYGRLIVKKRAGSTNTRIKLWLCSCDCGNSKMVRHDHLRSGHTVSCGCAQKFNRFNQPNKNKQQAG